MEIQYIGIRDELRNSIREWVEGVKWDSIENIEAEFRAIITPYGAHYQTYKVFGDTIILYSVWESENVSFRSWIGEGMPVQFLFSELGDREVY